MCDGVRLFRGVMSRLTGMDVGVHTRASMLNVFLRYSYSSGGGEARASRRGGLRLWTSVRRRSESVFLMNDGWGLVWHSARVRRRCADTRPARWRVSGLEFTIGDHKCASVPSNVSRLVAEGLLRSVGRSIVREGLPLR